jgi:cytochrome c oxidase cbb3-type subunit I/II
MGGDQAVQHTGVSAADGTRYDDAVVKLFTIATVTWAVVGMLVGVWIALEIAWWPANLGLPWTTFGRLRPLHTNAVIFAFGGNICFAGIYYSMQRLLRTRMFNDTLSRLHFWGWQLIIVCAAITLPLGLTQSKEYAELIWPIDVLITVVWVIFAVNFFGTIAIRKVQHLYVAIWFYMSFVITIAVLHIVNSLAIPASFTRSYPIYAGMTDALVQWWYGHNAVGFFLTTPFLGMMYYFLPRIAERPVFSYRLSIIHFWALVFLYIWAGPHHLLYSSLPEWAQTLGMVFSIMLIAPSWGGMINGLMTLRGAWDRVRTDPILKFLVVAISFYGMSTFEGPMMSIRAVNSLSHFTNWTIGHVHSGALGWNGMITFGILYWLVPRLWKRKELAHPGWATTHFWLATIGIVLYTVSMWAAGLTEGLEWRAFDAAGQLKYPNFVDIVHQLAPFYWLRLTGGLMYLTGVIVMAVNLTQTINGSAPARSPATLATAS